MNFKTESHEFSNYALQTFQNTEQTNTNNRIICTQL